MSQSKKSNADTRKSYRVALGGIVAGLCLMTMFLTGVFPVFYIAAPMAAGILLMILVEEVSTSWALLTYLAVSLLSLVVTYDKEASLMFIMFFGYYPLLRPYGMQFKNKLLRILWRFLLFNGFLVLDYWMTVYVLGLPTFDDEKAWMLAALALLANFVFLMYDIALGRMSPFLRKYLLPRVLGKTK